MTSSQYRAALQKLNLNQAGAAKFFGVSDRQGRRYALGEAKIPEGFAKLLRLMIELNLKPKDVQ